MHVYNLSTLSWHIRYNIYKHRCIIAICGQDSALHAIVDLIACKARLYGVSP